MIDIITPKHYLNKPGALLEAGKLIAPFAKRVFIVAGSTAFSAAGETLLESLDSSGIAHEVWKYTGYPTTETSKEIAGLAKQFKADALISLGGGRITDTTKTAARFADMEVIAIPTIASTCASFAPVAIMYTREGAFVEPLHHQKAPLLIIADTDILTAAPLRYLRAGIADTLAKWYEIAPSLEHSDDLYLKLNVQYGELARDILETKGLKVVADLQRGIHDPHEVHDVIDTIFLMAGLCGSIKTAFTIPGIAHPLYNAFSTIPELRSALHGEKVAFGLLVQGVLEKQRHAEIEHRLEVFTELELPLTLSELGLTHEVDAKLARISILVKKAIPAYCGLDKPFTEETLVSAIKTASRLAAEYREKRLPLAV
ncbi:MAG: iron-containing alcohol dehydrogenase family protein [Treponema sp.]|jgi:glycerol dehydrogenase|nr:iron-containing alcohol dehydrogenase family protein [Treponema sp.]